jgi:nucleoside 2-deoxyribosyltransferase
MINRIYIAGPLFSEGERAFNVMVDAYLHELGYDTFLPQRDGEELHELVQSGMLTLDALKKVFERDISEIQQSDLIVFIMDGRVPDDGACVEIGMAFAMGKECIGLKMDSRSLMHGLDNPMILGALKFRVANSLSQLKAFLDCLEYSPEPMMAILGN